MGTMCNQQSSIRILQYFVQIDSADYNLKNKSLKLNPISNKRNEQVLYFLRDCLDWIFPAHPDCLQPEKEDLEPDPKIPKPFIHHAFSQNKI